MIKRMEVFEAEDGTLHKQERGALLASVAFIMGTPANRAGLIETELVVKLPQLMPLFTRLLDPAIQAQAPKPAPAPVEPEDLALEAIAPAPPFLITETEGGVPGFEHPELGRIELGDRVHFTTPDDYEGQAMDTWATVEAMPNEQGWLRANAGESHPSCIILPAWIVEWSKWSD